MVRNEPRMNDSYILKQFFFIYFVYKDCVWPHFNSHNVSGPLSYWVSGETAPIVSALLLGFKCANLSPSQSSKPPESRHRADGSPARVPREWQPALLTLLKREEIVDNDKKFPRWGSNKKKEKSSAWRQRSRHNVLCPAYNCSVRWYQPCRTQAWAWVKGDILYHQV